MLRHLKLGWLLVIMTLIVAVMPASAQGSTPGLNVVSDSSGVTIYLVNSDGTQTQIFYIAAITADTVTVETVDDTAGQGGGSSSSVASSDVISTGSLIVNIESLNVRSGPGVAYTVIATVAGGDELHVIGRNDGRENWWFVELANGQRGWLNNIHVLARGDLRDAPVIEHQGVMILPTLYVGYPGNPLFPSVPHQGIATCYLTGNSVFTIIGRSKLNSYYEVEATCQDGSAVTGWIEAVHGIVRNPAGTAFPVTNN